MAAGLESGQAIVPQSSPVETGFHDSSEGKDKECIATTPEVRALYAAYSADTYGFCQVSAQDVIKDIQDAEDNITHVKPISSPVETTVNTIGFANSAMNQLDTITSTYLQPFRTFNSVVTGIANVRPSK